jgi:hypothetical protein
MKNKLLSTSDTKEGLEKTINAYFYSKNYVICDDKQIYNNLKKAYLEGYVVIIKNNRWRFERVYKS